jgi:D-3-phosphoglycerate dehydrogenase
LEASPHLRIVAKYSVGIDDVDIEAATDLGILVCNAPTEPNCFGVAESVIAMMLTMLKRLRERDADVRAGKWREPSVVAKYVGSRANDNYPGITLGLIGFGRIGSRVADLLAPWRMRIIGYDPYVDPMSFPLRGVEPADYHTLLRDSDVVSFHVPLTDETRFMLGSSQIELLKPSAIVINTAHGKIIDESALAQAISSGRLAGAAVDTFEHEPLPDLSPLRDLGDRVLLTPHSAAVTDGGELRAGIAVAAKAVLEALSGRVPQNVCNYEVFSAWKKRFGNVDLTSL